MRRIQLLGPGRPEALSGVVQVPDVEVTYQRSDRISKDDLADSPTCGPSGVLILTIDPAGAFHARPDRIGRVNSSIRNRGLPWIAAYDSWSTVNGDPALGRYAGVGVGIDFREARRAAPDSADAILGVETYVFDVGQANVDCAVYT